MVGPRECTRAGKRVNPASAPTSATWPTSDGPPAAGLLERLAVALTVGVVVFALAWISGSLTRADGGVSTIWPANAVVLAALMRLPPRRWPALLLAGFLGATAASVAEGHALSTGVGCLAHVAEILVCALGIRRFIGPSVDLSRPRHLWIFLGFAGIAGPLASGSLLAVLMASASEPHLFAQVTRWITAHALGLLIITPALTVLTPAALSDLFRRPGGRTNALLLAGFMVMLVVAYSQARAPIFMMLMPMMLVVAFRMQVTGAAIASLMAAVVMIGCLLAGRGPITLWSSDFASQALAQQFHLLLLTGTALIMGATQAQQKRLKASLSESLAAAEAARNDAVEAQRRTQLTEQIAKVGYWSVNAVTHATTWSDDMHRLYDRDIGSALDMEGVMQSLHPDDAAETRRLMTRALTEGIDFENQARIQQRDGSWRTLMSRAVCERGQNGEVIAVRGVTLDVTSLHLADAALRASETRYRLLAENATDMIIQTDIEGRVLYASPSTLKLTGYAPEALIGQLALSIVHSDDVARLRAVGAESLRKTGPLNTWQYELRIQHMDGRLLWFESRPRHVIDPATGQPCGITDTLRDISERKVIEAELRAARDAAEAAAEAKAEFLANMSHEIRTPLTGIIGFSGLLEHIEGLPETARRYVERVATSGLALLAVVNDILDFSKLDARQVELDPHPFEPRVFLSDTLDLLSDQAANKGLELSLQVDDSVPDRIEADSSRLRQVLLNLINNALKFTAAGGVTVQALYEPPGQKLLITVTDTGQGIPADRRDRMFQRFSQADGSINRNHGGTGLGLAICKGFVDLMGGEIGFKSVEGQGASFWFTISAPVAEAVADEVSDAWDAHGDDRPARILLVDDLPVNRELVRAMLGAAGHSFVDAGSGAEAVQAALGSRFDLIFMDLQMPGMDGLTATRIIRSTAELNRDTPIIALSANVLSQHLAACAEAGMDDHLGKPIRPAELLAKVAQWRDGRGPGQAAEEQMTA